MNIPGASRIPTNATCLTIISYRQFSVSGGPTYFNFPPSVLHVRMQPAIQAWAATGATVNQIEPDPGNDGVWFMGYKVTNPVCWRLALRVCPV